MPRALLVLLSGGLLLAAPRTTAAGCDRPASCALAASPCSSDTACPAGYSCIGGECRGSACSVTADCAAGGDCLDAFGAGGARCVCGGCAPWSCRLGCTLGPREGCRCETIEDCPSENDVCYLDVCS